VARDLNSKLKTTGLRMETVIPVFGAPEKSSCGFFIEAFLQLLSLTLS
jgi:hypothetical protein